MPLIREHQAAAAGSGMEPCFWTTPDRLVVFTGGRGGVKVTSLATRPILEREICMLL